MAEYAALYLFLALCIVLMAGFPVAFSLAGTALAAAWIGQSVGVFDPVFLEAVPNRIFSIMTNETLIAVPLFVFMGVMLERAKIAENLLETMAVLFGSLRGGLGISVTLVGMIMAASTGIVGATVVTMGLMALPTMLRRGYDPALISGTICASGTLGQIIPPSIILVLLGDVISSAYQQAQINMGSFNPDTVSVGDLFVGAVIPGLLLVLMYILYLLFMAWWRPASCPAIPPQEIQTIRGDRFGRRIILALLPPLFLILAVLGSILMGIATPTEGAAIGALGAIILSVSQNQLNFTRLQEVMLSTTRISSMVFLILVGAAIFSLVFRGFGGDTMVENFLHRIPGGVWGAFWTVMFIIFLLGFFLDFIEIIFIVVPIVGPVLLAMGLDPLWLGVMIAVNLQTSFLTPPFGFALFYLRGVAPEEVTTGQIYQGVIPFILLQLVVLIILAIWQPLITWLPKLVYGG
ncbi:MAG: TRAP transporter large permease subunit [Magnetococcales bacterium]|nr:TRAP transporter large permease subunit [Magnetococcales bacterium]